MPDSLFAPRRFRRSYLVYCSLAAFCLEGSLVGIAAIWPQNKTVEIPPVITEVVDLPPVQELILPEEDPQPTPDEPTPPPEETPPPDDTPPPDEPPEITLDTPKPTPTPGPSRKPTFVMPKVIPPNAKRGPVPQNGVVGGVPSAARTAGPVVKSAGTWHTSAKPPYPPQARASHITGSGTVRITTDASGRVVSASVAQSAGNGILDYAITGFAKANWSGPPNSSTTVPFTFRLQ